MPLARSRIVDHLACSVYHCVSRCVRRQFLLSDAVPFGWLVQRLELLASLFAIDVLEFAILTNHIHLLLRIRPELAWCWTDEEVAERWLALRAAGPFGRLGDASLKPAKEDIEEAARDEAGIDEWRRRLADLGWFHKELKEPCAKLWNAQDDVSGHFWEGRYSSKVALDDIAVTAQAFYVMLNAVRAGVESGVGRSGATSIGTRLKRIVSEIRSGQHGDAVEAYEKRIVNGSWQPVLPCRPGSVTNLSDKEYSARVARGRRRAEVRSAAMKESETIGRLATDAKVEDLVSMMAGATGSGSVSSADGDAGDGASEAGAEAEVARSVRPPESLVKIPRHQLRRRPSARIPADATASERSFLEQLENPFRAELVERGSTAVLPGMTLGTLVLLLDGEGRQAHPGKTGRIPPSEPAALDRIRAMALGGEIEEPAKAPDAEEALKTATAPRSGSISVALSALATLGDGLSTIDGHCQAIEELLGEAAARKSDGPAEPPGEDEGSGRGDGREGRGRTSVATPAVAPKRSRFRWFGSANGLEREIDAEAARRGSLRVVSERPLPAA
jgi:hypothetical protein